ncbi:hypothetical protein [Ornithinicoccus hortensis]|uniref:hypothetical protein n=1 Tax=Ornithinicoccus hortensis TaxID=82346 RepID=UPI00114F5083|nr:hypothetical protein [Ornithinicoccus hortensis]
MAVLPASVRVALWASAAFAGRVPVEDVADRAMPDLDHCTGLTDRLGLWRDLGEQVLLVALPRPGDLTGMPAGPPEMVTAALDAEELVFVPGVGGALVPTIEEFGPPGDRGWQARWTGYDADPVPSHVVQAVALPDVELALRRAAADLTGRLAETSGAPLAGEGLERLARRTVAQDWGVPEGLPSRAVRVIELAGSLTSLAEIGLDGRLQSVDSSTTLQRERILQELHDRAAQALVAATNVAALHLAGWR